MFRNADSTAGTGRASQAVNLVESLVAFDSGSVCTRREDFVFGTVNSNLAPRGTKPIRPGGRAPVIHDVPFDQRILHPAVNTGIGIRNGLVVGKGLHAIVGNEVTHRKRVLAAVLAIEKAFTAQEVVRVGERARERSIGIEVRGSAAALVPLFIVVIADIARFALVGAGAHAERNRLFGTGMGCVAEILRKGTRSGKSHAKSRSTQNL